MKRITTILVCLAIAAPAVTALGKSHKPKGKPAAEAAAKSKPDKALRGEYAEMAKILELDEQEKNALVEKVKARNERLTQWQAEHADELKALREKMTEARKAGDKEAAAEARKQHTALQKEKSEIARSTHQEILASLPAEQRSEWQAHQLSRMALGKYKRADLTDEQKTRVRELAGETVARTGAMEPGNKGIAQARKDYLQNVHDNVLTDEQREKLTRRPAKADKAEKAAKEKPGKADKAGNAAKEKPGKPDKAEKAPPKDAGKDASDEMNGDGDDDDSGDKDGMSS